MADEDLLPKAFTKERSLWAIYWTSLRIAPSKFNVISTFVVAVVTIMATVGSSQGAQETVAVVRNLASVSFASTLSILGFLVAGFTIFATLTSPAMLIEMGGRRHPQSGLSWLKHTFFNLLRTFVYLLMYAFVAFFVIYWGAPGGVVSMLLSMTSDPNHYAFCLIKLAFVTLVVGQYFVLVQLKSFIFNVYHSVVANIRWKAEGRE